LVAAIPCDTGQTPQMRSVGGVLGVAALEYQFKAPEHGPGAAGIDNLLCSIYGIDGDFDLQMPFYPGYRINNRYSCHLCLLL
jgi:hypothetical protein